MNKQAVITHSGMSQDASRSKQSNQFYFEGRNIRVTSTNNSTSGVITNEKGNELLLSIPNPIFDFVNKIISYNSKTLEYTTDEINDLYDNPSYILGEQTIIANCKTTDGFIIFSTNNNGLDCIWYLKDEEFDLSLLYLRNLDFSFDNPIQILNNYENTKIDKIYWIDGEHQTKFLNIHHSIENDDLEELIDLSVTSLSVTSEVDLTNPIIDEISYGGSHTAGMIQYAYSYYKVNGSQSALSPLSILIPLGKSTVEGGNVNTVVGTIPKIVIDQIDDRFTNLRLYAVKYTSYNELPSISLIADRDVTGFNSFTYYDDGRIIQDITLEEFIFLNGKIIIPKHIEAKDNRMFLFNYKDRVYDLSLKNNNIDFRAYSFPIHSTTTQVFENITDYDEDTLTPTGTSINLDVNYMNGTSFLEENHASINGYYHLNRFQYNSDVIGGEGPFLKYEVIRTSENKNNIYEYRFLKDDELYRIGIQLYNKYGIKSLPKWIADFVVSSENSNISNLNGDYAGLKISFKPEFYVWLNTQSNFLNDEGVYDEFLKPVGFKLLRADRTIQDRTIVGQGLINGMISQSPLTGYGSTDSAIKKANEGLKMPSFMRRFDDYLCPMFGNSTYDRLDKFTKGTHPQFQTTSPIDASIEMFKSKKSEGWRNSVYQFNQLMQFYSPEVLFEMLNNVEATKIKITGSLDNDYNGLKARRENYTAASFAPFSIYENCISPHDVKSGYTSTFFNVNEISRRGMVGPSFIHEDYERKRTVTYQYFREYAGSFRKNTSDTKIFNIYGKPEISDFGQGVKKYNNDSELLYTNSLNPLYTDEAGIDDNSKTDHTDITSVLSHGSRSVVFALDDSDTETEDRTKIEDLFDVSSMKLEIPGQTGGLSNTIQLDNVVPFYDDLISLNFSNQHVGVLETGDIYYNNNIDDIVTTYNFLDVKYIFDDLATYDAEATTTTEDWTGIKIAIVDHIDNKIYTVIDQSTSLAGLSDTGDTFDFLENTITTIDFYVYTYDQLFTLSSTGNLSDGYIVGVTSTGDTYTWNEPSLLYPDGEWVLTGSFINNADYKGGVGLIAEFINDEKLKYIGNYYGGNSYEAKTKTVYVEASQYFTFNLNTPVYDFIVIDPGDTFVQEYQIARISKSDKDPSSSAYLRITEIIKVRLESIVNQDKRNDESKEEWNSGFSPSQGDYHSYNRVYSQNSNLIKSQDISYELKINEDFNTGILASHLKRPGETIDNWTNISINNNMFLEGKYGAINAVIKHDDNIFTFQNNAIAHIMINPRVQVQASDGIGIQLGTGNVLYDFKYYSTNSGTLNKWGVVSTNSGIYYYDTLNNGIYTFNNGVNKLSDIKGLHSYLQKYINPDIIKNNNHVLKEGIQIGYDYLNNDIYFTFLQNENSDTLNFNEFKNEFISLHDFMPTLYFNKGEIFLTTNPDNNEIYRHREGLYNIYYGKYKPSYVLYNLNFEPYKTCVFNNINYKSEVYTNNIDQPEKTLTQIHAYNEYQDSGLNPLVIGRNGNLRRRFRDWNADIPRDGRERIRNPWTYLKLQFDNTTNDKLIFHDLIVSYTV